MESKKSRKVPIILYDGTLVKKDSLSSKEKCNQQERETKLTPVKINFINSTEISNPKNVPNSQVTSRVDTNNNTKVEINKFVVEDKTLSEHMYQEVVSGSDNKKRTSIKNDLTQKSLNEVDRGIYNIIIIFDVQESEGKNSGQRDSLDIETKNMNYEPCSPPSQCSHLETNQSYWPESLRNGIR